MERLQAEETISVNSSDEGTRIWGNERISVCLEPTEEELGREGPGQMWKVSALVSI